MAVEVKGRLLTMDQQEPQAPQEPQPTQYEPPRIELILTPEELEREVLYAGQPLPSGA